MDVTALSLCMENELPIYVFGLVDGNIKRVLTGEKVGTIIRTPEKERTDVNGIDDLVQDAERRMDKSVESTQVEFNTVRTGRASAALLDRIGVDYYGQRRRSSSSRRSTSPSRAC